MSERPNDAGLTPWRPPAFARGPKTPPHESGLPGYEPIGRRPHPAGTRAATRPPPPGAFGPPAAPAVAVTGQYQLAGWWSRVGATLLDGLIVSVGALILMAAFGSVF